MIKKLIFPNNDFTHVEIVSMYETEDIRFNYLCIDEEGNLNRKECDFCANFGNYPFYLTDEEYFSLKNKYSRM